MTVTGIDHPAGKKALLPVTVLSGFLGAGKTTLLKRILRCANEETEKPLKIAVLVNDMGEINIDAADIKNTKLIKEEAQMVELQNGCICCTLRGDLLKSVKALSEEQAFDYLVIESTGISEPLPVAQTFTMNIDGAVTKTGEGGFHTLSNYARLDTMVTVVDALNVYDVLGSIETLAEKNATGMVGNTGTKEDMEKMKQEEAAQQQSGGLWGAIKGMAFNALMAAHSLSPCQADFEQMIDDRSIVQLMLDQIEFANIIILSKAPLVQKPEAIAEIKSLLQRLNPDAKVIVPMSEHFADLPISEVMNTGLFDMEKAEESTMWLRELEKEKSGEGHTPETEEYGISSVIYRNHNRPFHPTRLDNLLKGFGNYDTSIAAAATVSAAGGLGSRGPFRGVVRAKGQFWIATANAHPINFQSSGRVFELVPEEKPYLDAIPKSQLDAGGRKRFAEVQEKLKLEGKWHGDSGYGDRTSELIFIGIGLDKARIVKALEDALVTDQELAAGPSAWKEFEDVRYGGAYFRPFVPGMSYKE
mmetsp:Transcript_63017/g.150118  ORF Transcript_63017/g.150118 Transcript_63017/m.150118 type:complete len:530 (+) Transcript_63017:91-1680(+)|eukprot:CAMPEP_0178386772 /NCGR_PEP_ID=MMETSP0689_2-20121128/8733_1 /TAXON_ID=160604 /ORGANISM="Amphidinium massartii, Strain CS-259" /LENGTH=529 /DNA_ID=CAMNT_0020007121 /DNA_START=69 /DNA_END=1658 /DNA_ORIENTATION=-